MKTLYNLLVAGKEKATVALIVSGVLTFLALFNISGEMTVEQALTAIFTAVLTALGVYFKRNN